MERHRSDKDFGLKLKDTYSKYDAQKKFDLKVSDIKDPKKLSLWRYIKGRGLTN